jgi:lipopolysaccharide/colanic/teichoic acid biosynthesis glycosyltransferase
MSVVGPRPLLRREVMKYYLGVNDRPDLPRDESVRLDLSDVDNWSMASDLLLNAKTVQAVLASDGAY